MCVRRFALAGLCSLASLVAVISVNGQNSNQKSGKQPKTIQTTQTTAKTPAAAKTTVASSTATTPDAATKNFVGLAADVLTEINRARRQPALYIEYLEARLKKFRGNELDLSGVTLVTADGPAAVQEAIAYLRTAKGIDTTLTGSNGLTLAAEAHLNDVKKTGQYGHKGSDGSQPNERVDRFGEWNGSVGELMDYQTVSAREIVLNMIVDDGNKRRGHREKMFNSNYTKIGIATGDTKEMGGVCVVVLAEQFQERAN